MPRYYCDYCDTYLTHDSPSVRKQHNQGYKHKANVRSYYQQFEEQQTQSLIDQKVREHLGQTTAFQGVGYGLRPGQYRPPFALPVMRPPSLPVPGSTPPGATGSPLVPGLGPPGMPRPSGSVPGYGGPPTFRPPGPQANGLPPPPGMTPPGAPSMPSAAPNGNPPTSGPLGFYQQPIQPMGASGGYLSTPVSNPNSAFNSGLSGTVASGNSLQGTPGPGLSTPPSYGLPPAYAS